MRNLTLAALRRFHPIMAGATARDRALSCVGTLVGIGVTALVCSAVPGAGGTFPLLAAPMGATAVLLFVVPASPMAQPWPIAGGNILSTLFGAAVAQQFGPTALAAGIAVSGAILLMSLCRCLHPPGGAAALAAVVGPPAVLSAGYGFAAVPIALNVAVLLAAGWLFHRISGHSYPHRPAELATATAATTPATTPYRPGLHRRDIAAALADLGETFDIAPDDLDLLLQTAERHAARRLGEQG